MFAPRLPYIQPERRTLYCIGVLEKFFSSSIVVLLAKPNSCLLKTLVIFLRNLAQNFRQYVAIETALIWLVFAGFFCVFRQSESICNLHSCYTFCTRVTEELHSFLSQSELSNFCVYYKSKNKRMLGFFNVSREARLWSSLLALKFGLVFQ